MLVGCVVLGEFATYACDIGGRLCYGMTYEVQRSQRGSLDCIYLWMNMYTRFSRVGIKQLLVAWNRQEVCGRITTRIPQMHV